MNTLTNSDISNKLDEIHAIADFCDRQEALITFEAEYKQTQFYKKTRYPLSDLYRQYVLEHVLSLQFLLNNLHNFINELDYTKLQALLSEVNANAFAEIRESAQELKSSGLTDILNILGVKEDA